MFQKLNTWALKTYLRVFGRDSLNTWVVSNFETMPTKVSDFANKWVADHVDELVRRYEDKSVIEIPYEWPDHWTALLKAYFRENGLTVIDVDDEIVIAWYRDRYGDKSGVNALWQQLLECHAKHIDNEKYAAKIFADEIRPKLMIGEVVFVSNVVWAQYGKHLGSMLYNDRARVRYDAGKERYTITIPHKARWEDAPLYNNPVEGYEDIPDEDIDGAYEGDEDWDNDEGLEDVDLDSN